MGRFLFTSRRRNDGGRMGAPEIRNPEREAHFFRRRLTIAGVLVTLALVGLFVRFLYLQVVQHSHYQTLAETRPDSDRPRRPQPGRDPRPQRPRSGAKLLRVTLEIQPARVKGLEQTIDELRGDRRNPAARQEALPGEAGRIQEFREPAAAHPPDRQRGRAPRRRPLAVSRRRDQGAAVPAVSLWRTGIARGGLYRPHQRPGPGAHRRMG